MSFLKLVVLPMMIAVLVGFSLIAALAWYGFFEDLSAVESGITGCVSGCVGIVVGFSVAYWIKEIEIRKSVHRLYTKIIIWGERNV